MSEVLICYPEPIEMDDELVTKLYRVRKTVLQMLNDRGYNVVDEELNQTKDAFKEKYGDDPKKDELTMSKKKKDSNEQVRRAHGL